MLCVSHLVYTFFFFYDPYLNTLQAQDPNKLRQKNL